MCDVIIDAQAKSNNNVKSNNKEAKTIATNFNDKNITCKIQNFYTLLAHFLIYSCVISC